MPAGRGRGGKARPGVWRPDSSGNADVRLRQVLPTIILSAMGPGWKLSKGRVFGKDHLIRVGHQVKIRHPAFAVGDAHACRGSGQMGGAGQTVAADHHAAAVDRQGPDRQSLQRGLPGVGDGAPTDTRAHRRRSRSLWAAPGRLPSWRGWLMDRLMQRLHLSKIRPEIFRLSCRQPVRVGARPEGRPRRHG